MRVFFISLFSLSLLFEGICLAEVSHANIKGLWNCAIPGEKEEAEMELTLEPESFSMRLPDGLRVKSPFKFTNLSGSTIKIEIYPPDKQAHEAELNILSEDEMNLRFPEDKNATVLHCRKGGKDLIGH